MDIKINEEYAKLVPPMTDKEYQGFKLSMEVDGQQERITLNQDGVLIDGHHRFRACKELKRQCGYEVKYFSSKLEEIKFIENSNNRRHFNDFQQAEFGYNLENIYRKYARERQLSGLKQGDKVPSVSNDTNGEKGRTADIIAKHRNISPSIYNRAKKILEQGTEEQKNKLRLGKSTVSKEYNELRKQEIKNKLMNEKQKVDLPDNCQLLQGDFMEAGKQIPDNSIDLILTDPPYGQEYLYLYENVGIFANRVLKEGGSLVTFPSYKVLDSLNLIAKSGLQYCWQICVKLNGHHGIITAHGTSIDIGWKPLFWFVKGNNVKTRVLGHIFDFTESQPPDKTMHEWEQHTIEAEHIIKGLTVENQIVLDPLMGYATNGVAALKLNRKFIGIEIDPDHYSNAERRLSSLMVTENAIKTV
jgi:hypothetical protein